MTRRGEHGIYSLNHELASMDEEENMISDINARLNAIESRLSDIEMICKTEGDGTLYD